MIDRDCFSGPCLFCLLLAGTLLSSCSSTPSGSNKGSQSSKSAAHYQRSSRKYHWVRKGDTLYAVSWKAGVNYKTLARWNGLRTPYTIYPGQKLRLTQPNNRTNKKKKTRTAASNRKSKSTTSSRYKSRNSAATAKTKVSSSAVQKHKQKKPTPIGKADLKWIWPAKGKLVGTYSSSDSSRDGIKIAGQRGQKIHAAETGQVVYVGSGLVGYGRLIIIKHNSKYLSAYGHNDKLLVKEGIVVQKGEHIADMGLTHSGRAMLHFEIRKYGKPVNPVAFLP